MTPGNRAIEQILEAIRERDARKELESFDVNDRVDHPEPEYVEHVPADSLPSVF